MRKKLLVIAVFACGAFLGATIPLVVRNILVEGTTPVSTLLLLAIFVVLGLTAHAMKRLLDFLDLYEGQTGDGTDEAAILARIEGEDENILIDSLRRSARNRSP